MADRLGPARLLTPEEAETQLAGPAFLLLAGIAQPVFPESSVAAPSSFVIIQRVRPSPRPFLPAIQLPVSINYEQWRDAVIPVLENPTFQVQSTVVRGALVADSGNEVVRQIGRALYQSFTDAGYGPPT